MFLVLFLSAVQKGEGVGLFFRAKPMTRGVFGCWVCDGLRWWMSSVVIGQQGGGVRCCVDRKTEAKGLFLELHLTAVKNTREVMAAVSMNGCGWLCDRPTEVKRGGFVLIFLDRISKERGCLGLFYDQSRSNKGVWELFLGSSNRARGRDGDEWCSITSHKHAYKCNDGGVYWVFHITKYLNKVGKSS